MQYCEHRAHQGESKVGGSVTARGPEPDHLLTPAEVAAMVAYICSPKAAATNGAALRVDGGVVRSLI